MGIKDKVSNEAENIKGNAKEATGKMTDNERLEAEGKMDQAEAKAKKAGEKAKDTMSDAKDAAKDAIRR
ncbi:CsbD family protein [Catellatospora sp. NPDC049609]|uniref:CsbD family protein n=1 Tax=Catellatospora sp. NPDC049609 TaxID=3155505 RepID=UPI003413777F